MRSVRAVAAPPMLVFPERPAAPVVVSTPTTNPGARLADLITMIAMTLLALGIVMIYSSSSVGMEIRASDATLFLRKQALWAVLAGCVFAIVRGTDVSAWRRFAWPIYIMAALALIVVLIPGVTRDINGARRWIRLFGMNLQPSEIGKLAVIIVTARLIEERRSIISDFKEGFLKIIAPMAAMALLIVVEPDFGSTALIGAVTVALIITAGALWRHLALLGLPAALGLVGLVLLKGAHVRQRIAAFFDPNADVSETNYQIRQAVIALGSGGMWGQGLGASRQKRLFLPEVHTDMIFALLGEELGFVGAAIVLGLYAALLGACFWAVLRARDTFAFYLGLGLTLLIGLQALINIAVATGSVPPKGIALPLISFGGSSLVLCAAALGIITNIALTGRYPSKKADPEPQNTSEEQAPENFDEEGLNNDEECAPEDGVDLFADDTISVAISEGRMKPPSFNDGPDPDETIDLPKNEAVTGAKGARS